MATRVVFTAGFSRRYTGGVREFTVEARNLRGVIKEMDRLYPGLGEHLEEETTVAIDGAIHETAYFQPIREGCEIFFIPNSKAVSLEVRGPPWRLAGGDGQVRIKSSRLPAHIRIRPIGQQITNL
ncbi:MAG TPA: hypothetical protein VHT52_09200 [Stellaceae bacterium]|jgi:hypothetical protein|nr:hypothetical protein [Stellaceae bacterium]